MRTRQATSPARRWAAFGASIRGTAHARELMPNQDAVACRSGSAPWGAVAVADGHGHALAVRADRGAAFAAALALEAACARLLPGDGARGDAGAAIAEQLPEAVAGTWLAAVEEDVSANPFSAAELEACGNAPLLAEHPETAYGTTLILAVATPAAIVACQIGDGDVLAVSADGSVRRLLPPDARLVGSTTTSLASRSAAADFRTRRLPLDDESIEVVVAATDGYVNSFSGDDGFPRAGRDLWSLIHEKGPRSVSSALSGWLESTSAEGTGDDATVAVLFDESRLAGALGAGAAAQQAEGAGT